MNTDLVKHNESAIAIQLRNFKPWIERLLPDPERFGAMLLATARRNPEILKCDPASVLGAALFCAQVDLDPGPSEHVYLIPRRNAQTGTLDCTVTVGYKGFKALAERHPAIGTIRTGTVHEHDTFDWTMQPPTITHKPKLDGERGAAVRWYAVATRTDGQPPHIAVLDKAGVEARRQCSSAKNGGPWSKHYDAMARKSAIRALWSELPSSLDMQRAAGLDEATVIIPSDLGVTVTPANALAAGDTNQDTSVDLPDEETIAVAVVQDAFPGATEVDVDVAEAPIVASPAPGAEATPGAGGGLLLPPPAAPTDEHTTHELLIEEIRELARAGLPDRAAWTSFMREQAQKHGFNPKAWDQDAPVEVLSEIRGFLRVEAEAATGGEVPW